MKRLFVLAWLTPLLAFGQGRGAAFSVDVETNYLSTVIMDSNSLHRAGFESRYQFSMQHFVEALDLWAGGVEDAVEGVESNVTTLVSTVAYNALISDLNNLVLSNDLVYLEHFLEGGSGYRAYLDGTNLVASTNLYSFASDITWDGSTYDPGDGSELDAFSNAALLPAIRTNAAFQAKNAEIANWNKFLTQFTLHAIVEAAELELEGEIPEAWANWLAESGLGTNGFPIESFVDQTAFTIPVPGFDGFTFPTNFGFQSGLRAGLTTVSNQAATNTAVISDATGVLYSVTFDSAYLSHYGYASSGTTRTFFTNTFTNSGDYDIVFPTNTAGSYAGTGGSLGLVDSATPSCVRGVKITEPGRYYLACGVDLSDLSPIASGTNAALEGSLLLKFQAYDSAGNAVNFWRGFGRAGKTSVGWVPDGLYAASTNLGPDAAYGTMASFSDMFLVTEVGGAPVSSDNWLELRLQARFDRSADLSAVDGLYMMRGHYLTLVRTATWGIDSAGGGGASR